MKHEFRHRWTGAVIHTEEIPNDAPMPVRMALEQAAMRGRPEHALRALRERTASKLDYYAGDEHKMLQHRLDAIDRELVSPSTRAVLTDAELTDAELTDAVLTDAELTRAVLTRAVLTDAELTDAELTDAVLTDAVLTRAELTRAVLTGAVLTDAVLTGAVLTGAVLTGAVLTGAVLTRAVLTRAVLTRAVLTDAELTGAVLTGAVLTDAVLTGAVLTRAEGLPPGLSTAPEEPLARARRRAAYAERYRARHPEVPVVAGLDSRILAEIRANKLTLKMNDWHGGKPYGADVVDACGTTHCQAGSAIHLAGPAGYALERRFGPHRAGLMIYRASAGYSPYFFDSDYGALRTIESGASDERLLAQASAQTEGSEP